MLLEKERKNERKNEPSKTEGGNTKANICIFMKLKKELKQTFVPRQYLWYVGSIAHRTAPDDNSSTRIIHFVYVQNNNNINCSERPKLCGEPACLQFKKKSCHKFKMDKKWDTTA